MARRHNNNPADEFHQYLRSLQTRALDISQTIAKLQLRERAPNWPKLLSQFAVLTSQLQTLYDELLTNERSWSSRLHSSVALFHPLSGAYNPATALRVKPVVELEEAERAALAAFLDDEEMREYGATELRDQINDFNAAALRLARFSQQAGAIPMPRDIAGMAAAGSTVSAAAAAPATAAAAGGVGGFLPSLAARRREDLEDAELQRSLAAMFTGRQTKLQPSEASSANTQARAPHPVHTQQPQQQQRHAHGSHPAQAQALPQQHFQQAQTAQQVYSQQQQHQQRAGTYYAASHGR